MTDKNNKTKPLKIHVSKIGSVKVDADEFFSHPDVIKQIEMMKDMDLVGKKLNFGGSSSGESD